MKKNRLSTFVDASTIWGKYKIAGLLLVIILASATNCFAARSSALSSGGTTAGAICAPAANAIIFSCSDAEGSTATTATAFNFTTTGSAVSGTDVTAFTVWSNSSNSLSGATSLGTVTTSLGAGPHTIAFGSTLTLTKNVTTYYIITATIPATATNTHTIIVSAMTHAAGVPFTFSGTAPSFSGTAASGGTQTITVIATLSGASTLCGTSSTTTLYTDATGGGVWTSSVTSVATVVGGLVTGVSSGVSTISYTIGACSSTQSFSYSATTPAAISGPSSVCPPAPVTLISESFEGGVPPGGWGLAGTTPSLFYQAYGPSTYDPSTGSAEDGNYVAEFDSYDQSGAAFLYTPAFSLVNVINGQISFWVWRDFGGYYTYAYGYTTEGFQIIMNTTPAVGGGAVLLGFVPRAADGPITGSLSGVSTPSSSGWYQYTASIPGTFNGATNYLIIRGVSQFGDNDYLDNVVVTGSQISTTALSDATAGGVWSSGNTTVATVNSSGVVLGVGVGTATVSYTNGCGSVSKTMSVLGVVTGTTSVCPGLTTALGEVIPGGAWTSGSTTLATVTSGGVVKGVSAGLVPISYSVDAGCILVTSVTVNPAPLPVTGSSVLCATVPLTLSDGTSGGKWSTSSSSIATIDTLLGTVSPIIPGTVTITYTLPTTCIATKAATVNPIPLPVIGNPNICVGLVYTLSDATPSGTWSSSLPGTAGFLGGSGNSNVTGLLLGPATLTYTLPNSCIATLSAIVQPNPGPITGNTTVCVNGLSLLSDTTAGGVWSSGNTAIANIGAGTGALVGVASGTPNITYMLPTGCLSSAGAHINPLPSPVSGIKHVCVGLSATLTDGGLGTWSSSNTALATVGVSSGIVTGVVAGNPVITYTLPATGCQLAVIDTVYSLPAPITGLTSECSGLSTTLNDATPGGTWSSTSPGVATVSLTGVVTATATSGTTNINYTIGYPAGASCLSTVSFTNSPLPTGYTVTIGNGTASASYCPGPLGTAVPHIITSGSAVGVQYQLLLGGLPLTPNVVANGTGSSIDFGAQPGAGIYTVLATNTTTGCSRTLPGTPSISVNALPITDTLMVSNGGSYCGLSGSVDSIYAGNSTVNGQIYLLYNSAGVNVGYAPGTGAPTASFVSITAGVYTGVVQAAGVGGCSSPMIGTVTVTMNDFPDVHTVGVAGSGNYCTGSAGVHVILDNSNTGIMYKLYNNLTGTYVDSLSGSNSSLDFGNQLTQGLVGSSATFTAIAVNTSTGCTSNMLGSPTINDLALPNPYTVSTPGSSTFCLGTVGDTIITSGSDGSSVNYQLYLNGIAVPAGAGGLQAGTGSALSFGPFTATGNYTIIAADGGTSCTARMNDTVHVSTYAALAVDTLSASSGSYCAGTTGVKFTLNKSTNTISYILYNGSTPVDTIAGTGGAVSFGMQTTLGAPTATFTAVALNTATTCRANMSGNPTIGINALPDSSFTVSATNGGNYCIGGPGVHINLGFSDVGINYQLYKGGVLIDSVSGSSSALDFGAYTAAGAYTVKGINVLTGCFSGMNDTATVTIKPLPAAYTVTGGGSYCLGGSGKHVGLKKSDIGISYQLYNGGPGITMAGTGGAIDFGSQTATGAYIVIGTDTTTALGCSSNMSGSAVITTNLPPAPFTVTGGGEFCVGSAGKPVGLNGSVTGIQYQLLNGISNVGLPMNGTGKALDFGIKTIDGNYTVVANNVTSSCTSNMPGSATILADSLPVAYHVTGGGAYCAGTGGADVTLSGSQAGVNYQVYNAGVLAGTVTGSGLALDLGLYPVAGTYTVSGGNAATGCSMNMTGSTNVSVNATPAVYTVTGSGHFCAGGEAIPVLLTGSHTGISYQLYDGISLSGRSVNGTGGAITLGTPTATGIYTAVATNTGTGCVSNMAGSGNITVDALPDTFAISGGGHLCAGSAGVAVNLGGSVAGINYQLYDGGTMSGLPVGGTGLPITFGLKNDGGTYTVIATNNTTKCVNNMTGATAVIVDPMVTPSVTISTSTGDDTACIGDVTTFTANAVNGGASPMYQWTVNGIATVATPTYRYIALNGDVVGVKLISDASCTTVPTGTGSLTMNELPYQVPAANITITPGNNVCHGTKVTLSATTEFGGGAPGYMWLKNSVPVGNGTSYSFTAGTVNNNDVLIFMLSSSYRCRTVHTDSVFSNNYVMTVDSAETPVVKVTSHLGPVIGVGQVDTFSAAQTLAGIKGTLSYRWMINNTPVPGATNALYIDHAVFNGDVVRCDVMRSGACGTEYGSDSAVLVNLKNVGVVNVTSAGSEINVLPNPNKGAFTVRGNIGTTEDEEVSLEVTNMLGQVVYKSKVVAHGGNLEEHIQLSNVANGMYLLNLHSEAANNVYHMVIEQ